MKRFGVGTVGARSLHRVASGLLLSSLVGCGAHGNANDLAGPAFDAGTGAGYPPDGAGGAPPSSDGSTGRLTEEEWARLTGPLEGEHTVLRHASYGCPARRIEQEYRIVPTVACAVSPITTTRRIRSVTAHSSQAAPITTTAVKSPSAGVEAARLQPARILQSSGRCARSTVSV
jgi:hypothetical protein